MEEERERRKGRREDAEDDCIEREEQYLCELAGDKRKTYSRVAI